MAAKFKVTLVVPQKLQDDLRIQVIKDGYGMRGKSKWVSEAMEALFKIENHAELVNYCDEMSGFEKVETIVISAQLMELLDDAIITVRTVYPTMEGVKSRIVRAAILQRLIRLTDQVT